jgi:hypothetical protein
VIFVEIATTVGWRKIAIALIDDSGIHNTQQGGQSKAIAVLN